MFCLDKSNNNCQTSMLPLTQATTSAVGMTIWWYDRRDVIVVSRNNV
jgi:hypothetical protein